jgi:hypothetical protein
MVTVTDLQNVASAATNAGIALQTACNSGGQAKDLTALANSVAGLSTTITPFLAINTSLNLVVINIGIPSSATCSRQ